MSRKLLGAALIGLIVQLIPVVTPAQISFIPGPPRKIPQGPAYVAIGEFNGDGIGDAAVASTVRDRVTVLFGTPSGDFESVVEVQVGQLLRGLTVGDFNGDSLNDFAVTDNYLSRLYVVNGQGSGGRNNGSFSTPQGYQAARRGPVGVATGNFDARPGLDAVTVNGAADSFTVFVNEGANRGLRPVGNFPAGRNPRVVVASDINGDRIDDLLILSTGTRGTDEVSLFLNAGTGTFQGVIPQSFVVGVGSVAMTSGDFNNDGRVDLAVLNNTGSLPNSFTLSVLLQDVSPFFRVLAPVQFSCPSQLNGVPILCVPQGIAAADFDQDTRTDLVLSFGTRATDTNQTFAGFVNAYAGLGDGSFQFATQIIVGLGPRNIAAGDVTGDAIPDVVVTEFAANTVRVLRAKEVPKAGLGGPCVVGRQCESGACVNGVCCATGSCPTGERCDVIPPGSSEPDGICKPPAPNGNSCTIGAQCASGRCVDGFCCASAFCPEGEYCNTGMCAPPAGNGTPCNAPEQCQSNFCVDGVCCSDPACAVNAACNIPGSEGICTTRQPVGSPCTDPAQCCTDPTDPTRCDPSFCEDGFCCERACAANESCGVPGREGECRPRPTSTAAPTPTPTPQPIGAPCTNPGQCQSTFCTDGVCCNQASCPAGQSCSNPDSGKLGSCSVPGGPGSPCTLPSHCTTGACSNNVCVVASPTPTPTLKGAGASCSITQECQPPLSCNTADGGVCCNLETCPAGQNCRLGNGACVPLPTQKPGNGSRCTEDDDCESNSCVDRICCEVDECEVGQRCDITGFEGSCVEPFGAGEGCSKNTDCLSPLTCQFGICSPPPEPTPTQFIPPPPTPTTVIVGNVDRSGGCSVDPQRDANGAWLLLTLPLALWIRRRSGVLVRSRGK